MWDDLSAGIPAARGRHGQKSIGIRWTIGDVSERGFQALRMSIEGAWRIFADRAAYVVCLNSVPVDIARQRTGALPAPVAWRRSDGALPGFLRRHLDPGLAEGAAWKFAPLQVFQDRHELALDNDCILWRLPPSIARWLGQREACLLAEDVIPAFGRFAAQCGTEGRNAGIRGFPPGFDLASALRATLDEHPGVISSELDEQGLQVAALSRDKPPIVVRLDEVSLASPLPPHQPSFGMFGAHFVGVNMRRERPFYDRDALRRLAEYWDEAAPQVARRIEGTA